MKQVIDEDSKIGKNLFLTQESTTKFNSEWEEYGTNGLGSY